MSATAVAGYDLEGSLLEVCTCDVLCPCWIGEDPDGGDCLSVVAYHFDRGTIRGVDVGGLTLVSTVHIPGNVLAGNWKQVVIVDDSASEEQADAMLDAFTGKLGGPLADLAPARGRARRDSSGADLAPDRRWRGCAARRRFHRGRHASVSGPRRLDHDAKQLDLLDGAGSAGLRGRRRSPTHRDTRARAFLVG
jgi:hypothetical protein